MQRSRLVMMKVSVSIVIVYLCKGVISGDQRDKHLSPVISTQGRRGPHLSLAGAVSEKGSQIHTLSLCRSLVPELQTRLI